jgi:hypothetical protein
MSSPTMTIAGIPVTIRLEELGEDCIVEAIGEDNMPTATVRMKCPYNVRYTLFAALKGTSIAIGRAIVRTPPFAYPPSTNLSCHSITDVKMIKPQTVGSGPLTGWVTGVWCTFTANFSVLRYDLTVGGGDPSGKAYTTTTIKVSAEVLTPPDGAFYIGPFPSTKKVEEGSLGIIRANCEINMKRVFVPYVPLDAAMTLMKGCVNSIPMQFADRVFLPGCLLFAGFDASPVDDPSGGRTFDLNYVLMGKSDDWNKFISTDGSLQFLNTAANGSGDGPYTYADLTVLP